MEYIIIGDTYLESSNKVESCLIRPAGKTKENADYWLNDILTNANEEDTRKKFTNIRIDTIKDEDAWWNDPYYTRD